MRRTVRIGARDAVRQGGRAASFLWARMRGRAWGDDRGAIAVALAVALPAIAGLAFLAVDTGRYYNLHTSLQSAADAFALAAAAELDRKPDSVTRAERAVAHLVENDHRFGSGDARLTVEDIRVRYYEEMPGSGTQPIDPADNPEDARYAEVRVEPVALRNPTIATVLGMAGPFEARAEAVGGFEQGVCEFAPFFICNPYEESSETSLFEAVKDPQWRRRLIALRDPGGSQPAPGNYGFLATDDTSGASELQDMLAIDRPATCFRQSRIRTEPGANTGPVQRGINVRFDIYEGNMNNRRSDPRYRPALNVRKGYHGQQCNQSPAEDDEIIRGLPRDDCLADGSCEAISEHMDGLIGDGEWDIEGYWQTNYGHSPPLEINGTPRDEASRYDVYLEELDQDLHLVEAGEKNVTEVGEPICYSGDYGMLSDPLDRRLLNAAVIDCIEHADDLAGRGEAPVTAFAQLFLTEPVGDDKGVWAELVELIEPGTPGAENMLRDLVQLHR